MLCAMGKLMKKYILIDKETLECKGIVKGFKRVLTGWRLTFVVALCLFVALFSVLSMVVMSVKHSVEVAELKSDFRCSLGLYMLSNDSLLCEIRERDRLDAFAMACHEVMTTPCPKATHDNVWEFIKKCDSWYPDIIMMQAVQESNAGKSAVARRCNNLFGMTKPGSRKMRCDINRSNSNEKYAEYQDWRFSIIDRILWERWIFRNHKKIPTIREYMEMIDKIYSETDGYGETVYKNAEKYRKML